MLAAFGPSLMPRASLHQGVAAGLAVLAGRGVSAVAELAGDPLALSAVRSGGTLIAAGALSGLAYDLAMAARDRIPGPAGSRIVVVSLAGVGATLLVARRRLRVSEAAVEEWTPSDKPADLARSVLIARSTVSSPRWFVMRAPGRSAPARR